MLHSETDICSMIQISVGICLLEFKGGNTWEEVFNLYHILFFYGSISCQVKLHKERQLLSLVQFSGIGDTLISFLPPMKDTILIYK